MEKERRSLTCPREGSSHLKKGRLQPRENIPSQFDTAGIANTSFGPFIVSRNELEHGRQHSIWQIAKNTRMEPNGRNNVIKS